MQLNVKIHKRSTGVYVVSLEGSLNTSTYPLLEKEVDQVLEKITEILIFDLKHLDYISSAGIRIIIKANKDMKRKGGKVMFSKMQPQIKKVFQIINALPDQEIFSSVEEMDNYLDAIQNKTMR